MKPSTLEELAVRGARIQIEELERFVNQHERKPVKSRVAATVEKIKKRRRMSAKNRKAVSLRMKRYWAARRRRK